MGDVVIDIRQLRPNLPSSHTRDGEVPAGRHHRARGAGGRELLWPQRGAGVGRLHVHGQDGDAHQERNAFQVDERWWEALRVGGLCATTWGGRGWGCTGAGVPTPPIPMSYRRLYERRV